MKMEIEVISCRKCPLSVLTWYEELLKCYAGKFIIDENPDMVHTSCPLRKENVTIKLENTVTLQQQPEIGPNCD